MSFFDVGVWVHVVVTVEGNDMKLYKNGVLTASETDGVEPQLTTRSQHWIGRSAWVDNGYFDGTIAFIRFWHGAALDNSTIQQLYKAFIVMSILGFIFVGVAVLHFRGIKLRCSAMPNIPCLSILMHIDTGTLKILWSTMQSKFSSSH